MRGYRNKGYVLLALLALCLMPLALAGCSGGGSSAATPDVIDGTVTNGGASTAGDVVKFDNLNGEEATVGAGNTYTISVPSANITGSDKLWIFDNGGNLLDVVPIVLLTSGGQTARPSTALPVIPTPPGGFAREG